jgi:Fe-S-cluster containining protein
MFFKIDFLGFKRFVNQKFDTEEILPITYFEDKTKIYLFKPKVCITYWAEIEKDKLENMENFKMEFLAGAIELEELPFTNQRIVFNPNN